MNTSRRLPIVLGILTTHVSARFVDILDPEALSTELARRVVENLGG